MRHLAILLFIIYTHALDINRECNGIVINGVLQSQEALKRNVTNPYQLAIDYDTDTLFFSYSTGDLNVFSSAYLNLKTNEFDNIYGIEGGFANAVDSRNSIVYLGGRDGIYKFSYDSKKAQRLQLTDDNIWQLFYKDRLYYSSYPNEEAYVLNNGKFERVPELVGIRAMLLCVDNYENIYFSNSSGLFIHKKSNEGVIQIGDYIVNALTIDVNGKIYFSTPSGIFHIDVERQSVQNLANIIGTTVNGIAIDVTGDIIYATDNSIIRLKPTDKLCPKEDDTTTTFL